MDVSLDQLVLILAAIGGLGAVIQHFGDRYLHNGLYKRTLRVAEGAPQKIASAVETALNASLDRQRALAQGEMDAAMKALTEVVDATGKSLQMSGTRQIGIEKQQMRELQGLMVDGILGPAMQAIEAWNPEWAEKLRQVPPDLLLKFLESPWFIANIKPRIQPYLDRFLGQQSGNVVNVGSAGGWGT